MITLSIIMLFCLAMGIGCDCSGSGNPSGGGLTELETQATVTVNTTSANMIVGDYLTIVAYTNRVLDENVKWETEDASIATVSEYGVIEAINKGTTNIVAKYGNATAKCAVTVDFDESFPVLIDLDGLENSYVVYKNSSFEFTPAIKYRGRIFYDGEFVFVSNDTSVVSFEGNVLKAKSSLGAASCYVEGSWRGFNVNSTPLLRSDFTVEIVNEAYITLKGTSEDFVELYTRQSFEGKTYKNSNTVIPEFYADGQKVDVKFDVNLTNGNIASYSNNTVVARKFGETELEISCEYQGRKYVKSISIEVKRPVADYQTEIAKFSSGVGTFKDANDGYVNKTIAEAIYGNNNVEIIEATQGKTRLNIEDNKIFGVSGLNDDVYHTTITISTETEIYNVSLEVYGLYITDAEDLGFFSTVGTYPNYYYLANDIDASDYAFPTDNASETGLLGVFEGNGYVISNLTTRSKGLFGLVQGGTIQNVAFTNAKLTGYYPCLIAHREAGTATLKNIYIEVDSIAKRGSALYQQTLSPTATHENVVVVYGISQEDVRYVMSQTGVPTNEGNISTFGPNRATLYKDSTFKNCYSISYAPVGCSEPLGKDFSWSSHLVAENQVTVGAAGQDGKAPITGVTDWDKELLALTSAGEFKKTVAASTAAGSEDKGTDVISGIRAYQTLSDFASDKKANEKSLSTFDSKYWVISDGVPYWKRVYNDSIALVVKDSQGNVVTDYTITDTTTKFTLSLVEGTQNVSNIEIIVPSSVKLQGNVISLYEKPLKPRYEEITVKAVVNGVEIVRILALFVTPKGIDVEETISYSLDDKSLDFETINKLLDLTGEDALTADKVDSYYIGGDIEEYTGEMILPVEITDYRTIKPIKVNILVGDKLYSLKNVMAYTKFIDEAEDLKYFTLKPDSGRVKGYFAVIRDIDASNLVFDDHVFASNTIYPGSADIGFVGVFDGLGHTISNITTKSNGIFGNSMSAVIKNVAFTNVTTSGSYPTLLAHNALRGKDESGAFNSIEPEFTNIYVEVNKMSSNGGVLINNQTSPTSRFNNVVVEYLGFDDSEDSKEMGWIKNGSRFSLLGGLIYDLNTAGYKEIYKNSFAISKAPLDVNGTSYHFGENQVTYILDEKGYVTSATAIDPFVTQVLDYKGLTLRAGNVALGVKVYDTYADMASDKANNTEWLATYDEAYWTIVDGVPYWKSLYVNNVKVVVKSGENVVSDYVLGTAEDKLTVTLENKGVELNNVTITAPSAIVVSGNTIKLAQKPMAPASYDITLTTTVNGMVIEKSITINVVPSGVAVNSVINYSAADKALDFKAINDELGLTLKQEDVVEYYLGSEVEPRTGAIEIPVVISGTGNNRAVEKQSVRIVIGDEIYELKNVMAYTKVIDEVEDLSVFVITQENAENGTDGYFVVTKDIDATDYVYGTHVYADGNTLSGGNHVGFKGVLDGQGHIISNLDIGNNGLFGNATAPVVKNIAFTNVDISGYYGALFAHNIRRDGWIDGRGYTIEALFENVYVEVGTITIGTSGRVGVLVNNGFPTSSQLKNVVVEYQDESLVESVYSGSKAVSTIGGNKTADMSNSLMFQNVYSISKLPLYSVGTTPYFGENQVEVTGRNTNGIYITAIGNVLDSKVTTLLTAKGLTLDKKYFAPRVKAYDSYAQMAQDAEANATSLATFDSKYWTVINGVPYWNGAFEDNFEVVVRKGDEVVTDYTLGDAETTFSITVENKGSKVSDATITAPSTLVVSGNTIKLAQKPMDSASYEVTISATVAGVVIEKTITINVVPNGIKVNDVVNYSLDDKALDFAAINKALGTSFTQADVQSYYVSGDVEAKTGAIELPVVISGTGADRKVEAQQVKLIIAGEIYELNNVMAYTKLIDEAEDLKYFTMTASKGANDGYYAVTKDIDASAITFDNHVFSTNDIFPSTTSGKDVGLSGVFDGQGHVISNVTAQSNGLFGNITASVIKNVAFTNVTLTGSYPALFAHGAVRAGWVDGKGYTLESDLSNVYVEVDTISSTASRVNLLVNNSFATSSKLHNVVVEFTEVSEETLNKVYANTLTYGTIGGNKTADMSNALMFENVYSISKVPLYTVGTTPYFGENQVEVTGRNANGIYITSIGNVLDSKVTTLLTSKGLTLDKKYFAPRVKAYDTYADMAKDAEANATSLAMFDSKYWTVVNGVPYWNGTYANHVTAVLRDKDGNAVSNVILDSADTKLYYNFEDGTHALTGATISAPAGVAVNGNQISLASNPTGKGTYEISISIVVDGKTITDTVTISYTNETLVDGKVLYSADDKSLDLPSLNKALVSAGVSEIALNDIDGYYVGDNAKTDELELEVIISNTGASRAVNTAQVVKIDVDGKLYILENVYAYTKLIDELADIDWFSRPKELQADGTTYLYDEYAGYYLVTKNIDGAGKGENGADYALAGIAPTSTGSSKDAGLKGVFDGNGYTISNVIVPTKGIFCMVNAAVIKNIAFEGVTLNGYYVTLIAHQVKGWSTLSNIYINGLKIDYSNSSSGGDVGILAQNTYQAYTNNVVVNYELTETDISRMTNSNKRFGLFFDTVYNYAPNASYHAWWKNVYYITKAPVIIGINATNTYWNKFMFASNTIKLKDGSTTEYELVDPTAFSTINTLLNKTYTLSGVDYKWNPTTHASRTAWYIDYITSVKQYADTNAMSKDAEANATSLATFDTTYWTIANGVPTWNSRND